METIRYGELKKVKDSLVATIGMFDGVHMGHRKMLERLTALAEERHCRSLVITFSSHPRITLKKDSSVKLLQSKEDRYRKIAALGVDYLLEIDFTMEFASLTASEFLASLLEYMDIRLLLLGFNNRFGSHKSNDFDTIIADGRYRSIEILREQHAVVYDGAEVSSTRVRQALMQGDILSTNAMLEEDYRITSVVESGRRIGRTLGFPTANIIIPDNILLPKDGVYAVRVTVESKTCMGVTNIGKRPTLDNGTDTTMETFIMDFSGDIYGKEITVSFAAFLRGEIKFSDTSLLRQQIEQDCHEAKNILS